MTWPTNEFEESVAHFGIRAPVFACCNFLEFDCSVGYLPSKRWRNMPIEIQLGYGLMFLERSGLRFVLAHELAHARHHDIPWMLDDVALSPVIRNLCRARSYFGCLPRIHRVGTREVDELRADRAAADFSDPMPFARSLLTSAAALDVYLNWLHTGTFKTQVFVGIDHKRHLVDAEHRQTLDEIKVFKDILVAFKVDEEFFQDSLAKAVASDKAECNYPSMAKRLDNLGLRIAEVRETLDLSSLDLIATDDILAGLPSTRRVAN